MSIQPQNVYALLINTLSLLFTFFIGKYFEIIKQNTQLFMC
jgi:hypothetical protein